MRPAYFCEQCKIDFDEAIIIKYNEVFKTIFPNEEQVTCYLIEKMEKDILWDFQRSVYAGYEKEISRKALLISIDMHLKYAELKNIVTFCKRCAAKMDLGNKLLCWTCKADYFDYERFDCCYKCYERNEISINPIKRMIWKYRKEDNNFK